MVSSSFSSMLNLFLSIGLFSFFFPILKVECENHSGAQRSGRFCLPKEHRHLMKQRNRKKVLIVCFLLTGMILTVFRASAGKEYKARTAGNAVAGEGSTREVPSTISSSRIRENSGNSGPEAGEQKNTGATSRTSSQGNLCSESHLSCKEKSEDFFLPESGENNHPKSEDSFLSESGEVFPMEEQADTEAEEPSQPYLATSSSFSSASSQENSSAGSFSPESLSSSEMTESTENSVHAPISSSQLESHQETSSHTHEYHLTEQVPPTCEEKGYRLFTCACSDFYYEWEPALGHEWEPVFEEFENYRTEVHIVCAECGYDFTSEGSTQQQIDEHTQNHALNGQKTQTRTQDVTVTYLEEVHTKDRCTRCGTTRDAVD